MNEKHMTDGKIRNTQIRLSQASNTHPNIAYSDNTTTYTLPYLKDCAAKTSNVILNADEYCDNH